MVSLYDIFLGDLMPLSGILISIGRNTYDPPAPTVPVNDIHHRTSILYDSQLASNGSGILYFNATPNVFQVIPGNSGAQTITTAVCFEAYDSVGGSGVTATTTGTMSFDTVRLNTHSSIFNYLTSNGQHELQINASGLYEFHYRIGMDNLTGTFQNVAFWVERQAAGGLFAEIPGTRTALWVRNNGSTSDDGTCAACFLLNNIGVGDKFRVRAILETVVAIGAEPVQIANYSNFIVKKLG